MSELSILVDMDVIVFRSALAGETKTLWQAAYTDDEGVFHEKVETIELNFDKSKSYMEWTMKSIVSKILKGKPWNGDYKVIPCLSDSVNFRKEIYSEYKANRKDKPKPALYKDCRRYAEENYECQCTPRLEADDQIGIMATSLPLTIIASVDKDFLTLHGTTMFNIDKHTFTETTVESARRWHLFQCLMGDGCDNVKGAKGIGVKRANAALDIECSWENVVRTYESKGQTEEDALLAARLVRILHSSDYDPLTGEIKLWCPSRAMGDNATLCNSVNKVNEEE